MEKIGCGWCRLARGQSCAGTQQLCCKHGLRGHLQQGICMRLITAAISGLSLNLPSLYYTPLLSLHISLVVVLQRWWWPRRRNRRNDPRVGGGAPLCGGGRGGRRAHRRTTAVGLQVRARQPRLVPPHQANHTHHTPPHPAGPWTWRWECCRSAMAARGCGC